MKGKWPRGFKHRAYLRTASKYTVNMHNKELVIKKENLPVTEVWSVIMAFRGGLADVLWITVLLNNQRVTESKPTN
ncbi:hypothetical protein ATANTOWER_007729 [Ataeniobius toweri]|uniref:Uncharacterized protein n=1 Tax=Ataeniobius toweri TaxID=208326 RepID=A0ABU7A1H3_9TELE|nr:hypothetical protein [Ataeniobius toweri]